MDSGHKLGDHLRLPGLPAQSAHLVDAHLVAEGKLVPIHKSLLALGSPVFADLFLSATNSNTSEERFPMPGHSVADICSVLKFLYSRTAAVATETPSNGLWKSIQDASPIIQFLHKFNMQIILQECDESLSRKAEADSTGIFKDNESTVAWAALAEDCGLKRLLANAELFMVKNADPAFWQSPAFNKHKLSSSCMLRMLQAAQLTINDWSSKFTPGAPQDKQWAVSVCSACKSSVWCSSCSCHFLCKPTSTHASVSTLISWQQSSKDGGTAPANSTMKSLV